MDVVIASQPSDFIQTATSIANVVFAAAAVVIAGISIRFTNQGINAQKTHNILSVKPIPSIIFADYENHLRVRVRNDGTGPLIINKISARKPGSSPDHDDLVSYMPNLPKNLSWENYSSGEIGSLPVAGEFVLLEIKIDTSKEEQIKVRNDIRSTLESLEIGISYTDVYGSKFDEKIRSGEWFGRRLASSKVPQ